jgi:type II secretory pathway pseudopilin PulG
MTKKIKKQRASTLVEVLVAVSIIALVLTAVSSMIFASVKLAESNEIRQLALQKNEEALEFFRKERFVNSWALFAAAMEDETSYCLSSLPDDLTGLAEKIGNCADDDQLQAAAYYFQREVYVSKETDSLNLRVDISWQAGGEEKVLSLEQDFHKY